MIAWHKLTAQCGKWLGREAPGVSTSQYRMGDFRMTRELLLLLFAMAAPAPAHAADVGVSVTVGQPGFYGRLDIGNYPQPQLIVPQPVVVAPVRGVVYQPVYLRVPPGHHRDWRKHCHKYDACGRPVYFVQDRWYNDVYAPKYRERHRERGESHGKGRGKGHDKGHGKGRDRD
jgi:hypothetical protein